MRHKWSISKVKQYQSAYCVHCGLIKERSDNGKIFYFKNVELFNNDGEWQIWMNGAIIAHPENTTIFDLIYHISKYNETATNKIELKFTEAFIKKITG